MSAAIDPRASVIRFWLNGADTAEIAQAVGWTEAQVYNFLATRRDG